MSLFHKLELHAARMLFRLRPEMQVKLSGTPAIEIDGRTLHPEMQLMLAARKRRGARSLRAETPELARKRMRDETVRYSAFFERIGPVRDFGIDGPAGSIRVRHYAPSGHGAPRPLLVFFHGGGFVAGDLDTHDLPCRVLCHHADVHVLSVDYRLAPEHPFPAAVEDASAALRWAFAHASELGADAARIAVGGDSAGGNLSAVLAHLGARGEVTAPAAQLLIYPVVTTQGRAERASMRLFASGFLLERLDIDWFDRAYLGTTSVPRTDPRISPLEASDFSGLCPAIVITAGFDPLRDEGNEYARKLAAGGVRVEHIELPGMIHGFIHSASLSPAAHADMVRIADALKRAL